MSSESTIIQSGGTINVDTSGEYNATLPTLTDGQNTQLQTDQRGRLITVDQNSATALAALQAIQAAVADLDGNTDGIEALLQTIADAVSDLEPNTDGIEAALASILAAVTDLDGNTDGLEALLAAIDTKLDTLDSVDYATQTTLAALNAKFSALGQKTMANSAPVVLASDQAAIPVSQSGAWTITPGTLSVVDQIDTGVGPVINTASNTIEDNAGAFLEAVASLAANVKKTRVTNTTGYFVGVYTGVAASEVLAFIISPGTDNEIEHTIASGTRISLRNMDINDITEGQVMMQFLG